MNPRFASNTKRLGQRGFTMPELLVVVACLVLMTGGTLLLLRPVDYANEAMKAERRLEVSALAQALRRYKAANGQLPTDVPGATTIIGSGEGGYNLCTALVPTYITDIPLDPQAGVTYKGDTQVNSSNGAACNEAGIDYISGYTIVRANKGGVTVAAPTSGKDAFSITVQ